MERWSFGIDNDKLIDLVLNGKKTATTSIYEEKELPTIGEQSIITYNNGQDACVVETLDYKIIKFKDIDENLSKLEGEGPHEEWKQKHILFFQNRKENFNDDTLVLFETFKVIKDINKKKQ